MNEHETKLNVCLNKTPKDSSEANNNTLTYLIINFCILLTIQKQRCISFIAILLIRGFQVLDHLLKINVEI